jgi:hypothetical protein
VTPEELHDLFRLDVNDVAEPILWSSEEIYSYIDDAQKMFCRLGVGILDSTSDLTAVAFSSGDEFATYDPRILRIRLARLGSTLDEVPVFNINDILSGRICSSDYGAVSSSMSKLDNTTGQIKAIVTDMEQNKVRLVYIPEEDDTLLLTGRRLPLESISLDYPSTCLEIDDMHHRHLMHWMKHLAYQKEDAETFDRARSLDHEARFRVYCEGVKVEAARREFRPRVVAYGGL